MKEGFPRGQREQTVNLPPYGFEGSNPSPSTGICGCSSVGRAPAFQAGRREFESRRPLFIDNFLFKNAHVAQW